MFYSCTYDNSIKPVRNSGDSALDPEGHKNQTSKTRSLITVTQTPVTQALVTFPEFDSRSGNQSLESIHSRKFWGSTFK